MKQTALLLIIGTFVLSFCGVSLLTLARGHLHEDAYILLQYVRNLASGGGITFDHVSGHAEGATDFLWMVILAMCVKVGLDPAVSATIFNALGLAAILFVIHRLRMGTDGVTISGMALATISGGTVAALGGFSTLFFGGLFALVMFAAIQRRYHTLSFLALVLGLVRPEGVLLGGGAVAALFMTGGRDGRHHLARALVIPTIIGLGYFLWRLSYFGHPLPLPLLVKASAAPLALGMSFNLAAIEYYIPLLFPLVAAPVFAVKRPLKGSDILVLTLGPTILFVALLFSYQAQNVEFRFQFPLVLSIIMLFVMSARGALQRPILVVSLAALPVCLGARAMIQGYRIQTGSPYIDSFPQLLRSNGFVVTKLALTEAGRLPYWYDAPMMLDLIGLNSVEPALYGPSVAVEQARPELLFVHHAGAFRVPKDSSAEDIVVVNARDVLVDRADTWGTLGEMAPIAALKFAQAQDYRAIFVRYGADDIHLSHVYFISPGLNFELFMTTLRQSFKQRMNYFQSQAAFAENSSWPPQS